MARLTELLGRKVVTRDGRHLGHVWDVRCEAHHISPASCRLTALLYGRQGLAERLGFRSPDLQRVGWSSVLEVTRHEVVIAQDTEPPPRSTA